MSLIFNKKSTGVFALIGFLICLWGCDQRQLPGGETNNTNTSNGAIASQEPVIEASPLEQGSGDWKVLKSDDVTLTVTAPGANIVNILYRPVIATDRHISLKTLNSPTDKTSGKFSTQL